MSISTRRRRVTVYPYAPTNDGGFVSDAYGAARGTFWARFSEFVGSEAKVARRSEHQDTGLFAFHDTVTVLEDDLLVENGLQWKVESITLRRLKREKVVRVFRTDRDVALPVS